jgi:hypothetical protein
LLKSSEKDDILKYWILIKLIPELPRAYRHQLRQEVERIYRNPNWNEEAEELPEKAKRLLDKINSDYV